MKTCTTYVREMKFASYYKYRNIIDTIEKRYVPYINKLVPCIFT